MHNYYNVFFIAIDIPEERFFDTINTSDIDMDPQARSIRSFSSLPVFLSPCSSPQSSIQVMPQSPSTQQTPVVRSRKRKLEANATDIAIMSLIEKHTNKSGFELIMNGLAKMIENVGMMLIA